MRRNAGLAVERPGEPDRLLGALRGAGPVDGEYACHAGNARACANGCGTSYWRYRGVSAPMAGGSRSSSALLLEHFGERAYAFALQQGAEVHVAPNSEVDVILLLDGPHVSIGSLSP